MMKLYDEIIEKELAMFTAMKERAKALPFSMEPGVWRDDGKNGIVLKSDMQCELGGGNFKAIGSQRITADSRFLTKDELFLVGPDIPQIKKDQPYARIAWILLDDQGLKRENDLYQMIRAIEYTRYSVNPHGYMQRISSVGHREPVRISRQAVQEGLDFSKVGSMYLQAYHRNPYVKAVKMVFFTDPDTDFAMLQNLSERAECITQALDHVLKDFKMNCATCNLKEVCDEVEELKELHFQTINK